MSEPRAGQLRRERNELQRRVEHLEDELRNAQHSVFRKRKEIKHLARQVAVWKVENPKAALRVKQIENLRSKLARVRFNGKRAVQQRDELLAGIMAFWDSPSFVATSPYAQTLYELANKIRAEGEER